ncbi:MAG: mismatch repair protein MutT [Candidatus Saccharibacteria bacterium]|jgi:8-oxo-dGTP diphosphatase|nr:mismatch repair protein MutT [Candidatus Saccharibacteria bacterium]
MTAPVPEVGVGLVVFKGNQILLGRRRGGDDDGAYGSQGGHLEHLELFEDAVLRELAEEAGPDLKVKNLRFQCIFNLTKYAPKHYVGISMTAEWESGEPQLTEPDKFYDWGWYDLDNLPSPLYEPVALHLASMKSDKVYIEVAK